MVYHHTVCQSYKIADRKPRMLEDAAKTTLPKIDKAPQTLRDLVQDRMRTAIIDGHFAPGERLVERPLCEQLGVSRTVIRETIRYLEAEGLVDILPNRGPIVAVLDRDTAQQIYDIRRQLESAAARACATAHGPAFRGQLEAALAKLEATTNAADRTALIAATTRFYELIFEQAGHRVAWEIVQRLNGRISRLRALTLSSQARKQPGIQHMRAIATAILARDAAQAGSAVVAHLEDAADVAHRLLSAEDAQSA